MPNERSTSTWACPPPISTMSLITGNPAFCIDVQIQLLSIVAGKARGAEPLACTIEKWKRRPIEMAAARFVTI
jgi:hypothetical protein